MNYSELIAEVLSICKRPDKLADIRREINAACSYCCVEGAFAFDLHEQSVAISPAAATGNIQLSSLTRFRKVKAIRPPGLNSFLRHISPDKIFYQNKQETNVFYIAGTQINFNLSAQTSSLLVSYYSYPEVLSTDSSTNWLVTIAPWVVIYRTAAAIFTLIGDDTTAARYSALFTQAFLSFKKDVKHGVSYE